MRNDGIGKKKNREENEEKKKDKWIELKERRKEEKRCTDLK